LGRAILLRLHNAGISNDNAGSPRSSRKKDSHMFLRILLGMAGMLLLVGCANSITPPLPPDHPANPVAAESPLPAPSQTLAVNDADISRPITNADTLKPDMGGMQHDMEGMQHDHDMAGMKHDMAGMKHDAPATQPGENAALSAPRWTPTTLRATTAATLFTCKMHPEVISNTPGKCPKCGMKLVVKEGK
jgi:hypothetical protein